MKWNIFNTVTVLEQQLKDLTDFNRDHSQWILQLKERLNKLENANQLLVNSNQALIRKQDNFAERLQNLEHEVYKQSRILAAISAQPKPAIAAPDPRLPVFPQVEVNTEANEKLLKKRQYQREWNARKKAKKEEEQKIKAQREKKNAYARAYYARTKGIKK